MPNNNHTDFQRFLLDNEQNPETDIILMKMLEDSASEDPVLEKEGFQTFALRSGLSRRQRFQRWSRQLVGIAAALFIPAAILSFWALRKASDAQVG